MRNLLPLRGWWVFVVRPALRFGTSFTLIFGGLFLLISQVFFPLFFSSGDGFVATPLQESVLGIMTETPANPLEGIKVTAAAAATSFTTEPQSLAITPGLVGATPSQFYLSIPKLGIDSAVVETNSLSLSPDTALGHYRGTSLPGDLGTAFIYGHSTLPWFFNPTNYKTIFSTVPTLVEGDKFLIHINDLTYQYEVVATKILDPSQVDPLKDYGLEAGSSSSVVLMTCYPPGLSTNRFLAIGKLIF